MTPARPTAASTSATAANAPSRIALSRRGSADLASSLSSVKTRAAGCSGSTCWMVRRIVSTRLVGSRVVRITNDPGRSEEHTSELQSHSDLVCRLLLEKKKKHKEIHS